MRILDANNNELIAPNLDKGRLEPDKIFVAHHGAVEGKPEDGHYKTVAEYPNGGKDVAWVVDVPGVAPRPAWDEYEDIQRYIPYTEEEIKAIEDSHKSVWDLMAEAYKEGVQQA